jgi:hypothetical protein
MSKAVIEFTPFASTRDMSGWRITSLELAFTFDLGNHGATVAEGHV